MIALLQSYGHDPTRLHPYLRSLVRDGLVSADGSFVPAPQADIKVEGPRYGGRSPRSPVYPGALSILLTLELAPKLLHLFRRWTRAGGQMRQSRIRRHPPSANCGR